MPRKTDSNAPGDWLFFVESDLDLLHVGVERELSYVLCRSKLAELLEKVMKAELIRRGWILDRTHDLRKIGGYLAERNSDLMAEIRPLCDRLADAYFIDRYPGFDLDDPDWPALRAQLEGVTALAAKIRSRLPASQL